MLQWQCLRFKPLHASTETHDKQDPYASLHEQPVHCDDEGKHLAKRLKTDNPYNYFNENWQHYLEHTILPTAEEATRKLDLRMEWPSIWECKEIVLKLMALAQIGAFAKFSQTEADKLTVQEAEDVIKDDQVAQAYLQNRLTLHEYSCYIIRDVAKNLDAFGTAKAARKDVQ